MTAIRRLLARRHLALLICAAALLLKLLIPGGYMVSFEHGRATLTVCSGLAPQAATAMASMHHTMHGEMSGHGPSRDHGKPDQPCAFAGLSAQATGAVDAIMVVAAIGFILAMLFAPALPLPPSSPGFLRPPLRGPPVYR